LQHTSETLETHVYIIRFQHNISLLLGNGGSSAREFTGAELAALVEKAAAGPVEKVIAGRSGGEGGPYAREAEWGACGDGARHNGGGGDCMTRGGEAAAERLGEDSRTRALEGR
jgi:hypothetical protein